MMIFAGFQSLNDKMDNGVEVQRHKCLILFILEHGLGHLNKLVENS